MGSARTAWGHPAIGTAWFALLFAGCAAPRVDRPAAAASAGGVRTQNTTEQIALVADASVKDSLARRNDVKFGTVKIDGEKTDVALSTIAAESVADLEVTQAPTPDLDADTTGGLLSVQTKPATDLARRALKGSVALDWSSYARRFGEDGAVTFGNAFGRGRTFGFLASVNYEQTFVNNDVIGRRWNLIDLGTGPRYVMTRFTPEAQVRRPRKLGFNGTIDWKPAATTALYFRTNFNDLITPANNRITNYRFGSGLFVAADDRMGATRGADILRTLEDRHEDKAVYTLAAGGTYRAAPCSINFRVSRNIANTASPRDQENEFIQRAVDLGYRLDDGAYPTITVAPGENWADPGRFGFSELRLRGIRDYAADTIGSLDVKVPQTIAGAPGIWKVGGKFRTRTADHLFHREIYDQFLGNYTIADVLGDYRNPDFLGGRYPVAGFPDAGAARRFFASHFSQFGLDASRSHLDSDPSSYRVSENVAAGYGLADWQLTHAHLILGVRAEQTFDRYTGYEVQTDATGAYAATNRLQARRDYVNVFPGMHLVVPLPRGLRFAVSVSESITRPNYTDLVPSRVVNRATSALIEGNPQLAATTYANLDATLEWLPAAGAKYSVEGLHQQIAHTIFPRSGTVVGGIYDGFEFSRPANGVGATLDSMKLRAEQKFTALPGALAGLGFAGTFYVRHSTARIPGREGEHLPLAQTPRQESALSLIYDRGPYYGSVDFTRFGRSLQVAGRNAAEDTWYFPLSAVAASLSYQWRPAVRLFADITNFTMRPVIDEFYGTAARRNGLRFESGRAVRFGIKLDD